MEIIIDTKLISSFKIRLVIIHTKIMILIISNEEQKQDV